MSGLDTAAMKQRFQQRADAVRNRNMPPIAGAERKAFVEQAELDYRDFLLLADAEISLDGGVLTVDLRPAICDATIRGVGHLERETKVAMENIAKALPTDGNKITPGMLDSKADLKALIDGAEMFRVVETVDAIEGNTPGFPIESTAPGFSLTHGYLL
tara:strand:- start:2800 stop:3273 length:474 start_codon:yes stop_codon:yes gene_type:complete